MPKGEEHSYGDKKKPQHSLKEKRQLKLEKRAAKQAKSTITPGMLQ